MRSPICDMLGIEFPLVAFTHCRDVVVEVSKAGGMGVLGAAGMSPDKLERELTWIDEQIDGKPYGVDLIVLAFGPEKRSKNTKPGPFQTIRVEKGRQTRRIADTPCRHRIVRIVSRNGLQNLGGVGDRPF